MMKEDRKELISFLKACATKKIDPSQIPKERPSMTFSRMKNGKYTNQFGEVFSEEEIDNIFSPLEIKYSEKHGRILRFILANSEEGENNYFAISIPPLTKEEIKDIIAYCLSRD